jgi:hypothetical protein
MPLGPMRTKAQKQAGMHQVMGEFKRKTLHSGSKKGPVVKSRAQAIAIALKQTHQSKYAEGGPIDESGRRHRRPPISDMPIGGRPTSGSLPNPWLNEEIPFRMPPSREGLFPEPPYFRAPPPQQPFYRPAQYPPELSGQPALPGPRVQPAPQPNVLDLEATGQGVYGTPPPPRTPFTFEPAPPRAPRAKRTTILPGQYPAGIRWSDVWGPGYQLGGGLDLRTPDIGRSFMRPGAPERRSPYDFSLEVEGPFTRYERPSIMGSLRHRFQLGGNVPGMQGLMPPTVPNFTATGQGGTTLPGMSSPTGQMPLPDMPIPQAPNGGGNNWAPIDPTTAMGAINNQLNSAPGLPPAGGATQPNIFLPPPGQTPTGIGPTAPGSPTGMMPLAPGSQPTGMMPLAPGSQPTGMMPTAPGSPTGMMPTAPGSPTGMMPTAPGSPTGMMPTAPGSQPTGIMPPPTQPQAGISLQAPGSNTYPAGQPNIFMPPPGQTMGSSGPNIFMPPPTQSQAGFMPQAPKGQWDPSGRTPMGLPYGHGRHNTWGYGRQTGGSVTPRSDEVLRDVIGAPDPSPSDVLSQARLLGHGNPLIQGMERLHRDQMRRLSVPRRQVGGGLPIMGADYLGDQQFLDTYGAINRLRVKPKAWDRFLREQPRSTHIEDRRAHDPTFLLPRPIDPKYWEGQASNWLARQLGGPVLAMDYRDPNDLTGKGRPLITDMPMGGAPNVVRMPRGRGYPLTAGPPAMDPLDAWIAQGGHKGNVVLAPDRIFDRYYTRRLRDRGYQVGGGLPYFARQGMSGLAHSGMIASSSPGRGDHLGARVRGGSYVIPADIVSAAGQGNSLAGAKGFDRLLRQGPYTSRMPRAGGIRSRRFQLGGDVSRGTPVALSGGEYVVSPEHAAMLGGGDIDHGHNILDEVVRQIRRRNVHDLRKMPGPKGAHQR